MISFSFWINEFNKDKEKLDPINSSFIFTKSFFVRLINNGSNCFNKGLMRLSYPKEKV